MSESEPASEKEATMTANGSGPPPENTSAAAVSDEKDNEEKNDVDEKKDSIENTDLEEKKEKENGMKMVEDVEEEKEDKKMDNVIPAEPEDVKMVDIEDSKKVDSEDVKMVDGEIVKDEEEKGKEIGEEEGSKPVEENNVRQEKDDEETEKNVDENKEEEGLKKKRMRGPKASGKGEAKQKKGEKKSKEPSTPVASSVERPVRERKTVERLVEVIEKGPNRDFLIEKGRGTPLKDIPNVAYKLSRKKPADLKLLHQTLFGRRGKAVDFKHHILQFSGFVWHESDEKQKAKMKEKLDKYVKDTLLDLCDLFDISISRATTRKEDLVAKLLDFMAAPHAQTDVLLAEREQSAKSRKRKRVAQGSASKSMGSTLAKRSRKKHPESEGTPNTKERNSNEAEDEDDDEDEDEEEEKEDDENGIPAEEKTPKRPESEVKESESEEEAEEDEDDEKHSRKVKRENKRFPKRQGSVGLEKSKLGMSSKKAPHRTTNAKNPIKRSSSKLSKAEEDDEVVEKVFSRKKKNVAVPKKKSKATQVSKEKGEKLTKGKVKPEAENPSKEELRKKICEILKEVDFNTATFTDILKQLATHYKVDLTPRKAAIKLIIQEELTKLADDDEENEDEEDAEEGNPEPAANEVEA